MDLEAQTTDRLKFIDLETMETHAIFRDDINEFIGHFTGNPDTAAMKAGSAYIRKIHSFLKLCFGLKMISKSILLRDMFRKLYTHPMVHHSNGQVSNRFVLQNTNAKDKELVRFTNG